VNETSKDALKDKLKALPAQPGCYIYKDESGDVLYVGKAVSLRSRVRSYFQKSTAHSIRIARMVSRVRGLEWIVTDTELEALILECNLIKRHRPPFNVRLRDDKSYPYIVITKEPFPRVLFTRKLRKDGSRYFGPYSSAFAVRDTLQLLHKVFKLIPCGKSWTGEPVQRPCLYFHMGRCMAPCAGMSDRTVYQQELSNVTLFLEGKHDALVRHLRAEMDAAAEKLDFERAGALRDTIASIELVLERQKVVTEHDRDQDVIALVKDDRGAAVQMFYVRGGKLIGQRHFYLDGARETSPSEAVEEFVKRYYTDAPEVPGELLLPVEIEERHIVESWLKMKRGRGVKVTVPRGGEKLRLIEMAANNAESALEQLKREHEAQENWQAEAGSQLQDALNLESPPERIECFDISNIQGTAPVASMVVVEGGMPAKSEYRRFKIKYNPESPDDFAMMRETIMRRLRAFRDGQPNFQKLPDLMVIDGGKGQLSAAMKAMEEIGLQIPAVGLAKKQELLFLPNDPEPIALPMNSPGLLLLRRLRDEAHRFAISYHRKLRDKRLFGSPLDEIVGVGPRRRRMLLRTFGSVAGIRDATVEQIAAVPTMTLAMAKRVKDALSD
jgi:excinuclease ABC subunit C